MKHLLLLLLIGAAFSLQAQTENCTKYKPIKVVVLGSSTAAGTGPSVRDSAWVWRYRAFLESLNPDNEVINLARGGYVTYRLMPHGHQPPTGRPTPDSARNITEALSLNPDAIIINMPSNDRQYPIAEQLANFDSLYRYSNSQGVPMWICTTQPITSAGAYQREVRDSIVARYGSQSLDFWTGIVKGNTNLVDSTYAADAVHLNDLGHRVLIQVVQQAKIPEAVFQAALTPDLAVVSLDVPESGACIDQMLNGQTVIINLGKTAAPGWEHGVDIDGSFSSQVSTDSLRTCQLDTIFWSRPLTAPDTVSITASSILAADIFTQNDSLNLLRFYQKSPTITGSDTAICATSNVNLTVASEADTVLWYDSPIGGSPIMGGDTLSLTNVQGNTIRYAQAVRGELFNRDVVTAATAADVDWNGVMFDIIASDDLIIDSLEMFLSDSGRHEVTANFLRGPFLSESQNPVAWTPWGTDSATFVSNTDPVHVDFGSMAIAKGDTLGVYLHMTRSNIRLRYQRAANAASFKQGVLEVYAGQGVSHTFGQLYFPRHWQGRVFYHYGERLEGDCATPRIPIAVEVDTAAPEADFSHEADLWLPGDYRFQFTTDSMSGRSFRWDFGDGGTGSGASLIHSFSREGRHFVQLIVENACGSDTIIKEVNFVTPGIADELPRVQVYPNPALDGQWQVDMGNVPFQGYSLVDVLGKKIDAEVELLQSNVYRFRIEAGPGMYCLRLRGAKPVWVVVR
ncbi:MAG: PKD domain-containing protein [Bacteroidia bacterium]